MIVRILTEGQWQLDDAAADRLRELDDELLEACRGGDEARFREVLTQALELVRQRGTPLADDDLSHSEVMLPPPDITFAEAQREFTGEGLLPD